MSQPWTHRTALDVFDALVDDAIQYGHLLASIRDRRPVGYLVTKLPERSRELLRGLTSDDLATKRVRM